MSSTSAVAVLAQGLRDLRDYAEGPDGEDLRERTGLSAQQIDAALAGEQLPSPEVTLALVAAWEGDVEAWRAYWAQIAELAKSESENGNGKKKGAPTPPEPSIITPIPVEDAPEASTADAAAETVASQAEAGKAGGAGTASGKEGTATAAEPVAGGETAAVPEKTGAGATPEAATGGAAGTAVSEQDSAAGGSDASADAPTGEAARADGTAGNPAASEPAASAAAATPGDKSALARVGIPVLLFAVGAGVGAFGDHALNSKSSTNPQSASLPTISQSQSAATATAAGTAGPIHSSQPSSSSPTSATTSSSSPSISGSESPSFSTTASPGTTLGAYSNIQLASGYSVDFFNDTYHPVPGTSAGPDTMSFFASSFVDGRFYADRVAILDPQDTGTFAACRNNTRYQHDVLLSQVSAGTSFCVHTTTGHLALVTVRRMPSSTDANPYAVLDLTVWQDS